MKKILLIVLLAPVIIAGQNLKGRFSSSLYTFERYQSADESEMYVRGFQALSLKFSKENISVKTRLNLETNFSNTLDNDPRLRFYNLYLEWRKIAGVGTIKIGRQPLYNLVAGGIFDGVSMKVKNKLFTVNGFYGGNVPAYQKLEITDKWNEDFVLGGKISTTVLKDFRFALGYINKNFKSENYMADRLDADLNPIQVLIERNSMQFQYVSAEASYNRKDQADVNTKVYYDLNFYKVSKFEIGSRFAATEKLGVSVYYNYRAPKLRYNSIFAVFDYGNTQEIEGGLDYKVNKTLSFFGKFGNVTYEDENSQRITAGVNTCMGSLSYRKTLGYAGELDAFSLYTSRSYLEGQVTPSVGFSYTSYKLSPEDDSNSLITLLAGVNYRPMRAMSFDLQAQYLNNKIYKNDMRILFKFNHWFNTNF